MSRLVGWLGLAAILVSGLTFTASTPFPGYAALLPTLGAAAVLWAGVSAHRTGLTVLLGIRPLVWVGGLSYSLYLWHWPLIVIATAMAGTMRIRYGLAVAAFSLVPAWLSLVLVERPVLRAPSLRSHNAKSLLLGAMCSLLGVAVGTGLQLNVLREISTRPPTAASQPSASAVGSVSNPGAAALLVDPANGIPKDSFDSILPLAVAASGDAPQIDGHGSPSTKHQPPRHRARSGISRALSLLPWLGIPMRTNSFRASSRRRLLMAGAWMCIPEARAPSRPSPSTWTGAPTMLVMPAITT